MAFETGGKYFQDSMISLGGIFILVARNEIYLKCIFLPCQLGSSSQAVIFFPSKFKKANRKSHSCAPCKTGRKIYHMYKFHKDVNKNYSNFTATILDAVCFRF